jgi:RHS repeat-associated protein
VALVDGSGASTTAYTYEPYGKPTAGDLSNPFTFTGREWDGTTGLQLNRFRFYSPSHGRFISEDPIGEVGGVNLYEYAGSSPTTMIDPLGLEPRQYGDPDFEFQPTPPQYYYYGDPSGGSSILEALLRSAATLGGCLTGAAGLGGNLAFLGPIPAAIGAGVGCVVGGVVAHDLHSQVEFD